MYNLNLHASQNFGSILFGALSPKTTDNEDASNASVTGDYSLSQPRDGRRPQQCSEHRRHLAGGVHRAHKIRARRTATFGSSV